MLFQPKWWGTEYTVLVLCKTIFWSLSEVDESSAVWVRQIEWVSLKVTVFSEQNSLFIFLQTLQATQIIVCVHMGMWILIEEKTESFL